MTTTKLDFLLTLESVINQRLANPPAESYTAQLAADGQRRIAQKVGEEAVELALAAVDDDRRAVIDEAADLLYHMLVLLNTQGTGLSDVVATLEARHSN